MSGTCTIPTQILDRNDRNELRHLEEQKEQPRPQILQTFLARHPHLNLTGRVGRVSADGQILGVYCDILTGFCSFTNETEDKVAVKKLRLSVRDDGKFQKRLAKELYIWSKVKHPRILPLEGVFLEDDSQYTCLVSRWMVNGTILKYIASRPGTDVLPLILGIAEGISYLHASDITHSDIKPENVLISDRGGPLLCDFGISRMLSASKTFQFSSTSTAGLGGTIRYMSKELVNALQTGTKAKFSKASDVWAFGMTVVALLTKKRPYFDREDFQVLFEIPAGRLPSLPMSVDPWSIKNQILWRMCRFCWKPVSTRPTIHLLKAELYDMESILGSGAGAPWSATSYPFSWLDPSCLTGAGGFTPPMRRTPSQESPTTSRSYFSWPSQPLDHTNASSVSLQDQGQHFDPPRPYSTPPYLSGLSLHENVWDDARSIPAVRLHDDRNP